MPGSNYYDHTTYPSNGVPGSSSAMRSELDLIEAGFGKLPDLSIANADRAVFLSPAGDSLISLPPDSARAKLGTGTNLWCGTATGTKNALTLTPTPAVTAYAPGQRFLFKSGSAASDATVIAAVSGLPSIAVQVNGAALVGGEIAADTWYEIVIDASLTSCQLSKVGRATLAELGAASTADLAASSDLAKGATLIGYLGGTLRAYLNQFITSAGASIIGWIQSGTGAILRLVQDKLRDIVHVKDFLPSGFVTDGSVDYVVYIQKAIDEVYSRGGGNIDCSGGKWLIDSANLVVKQGVFLVGPYMNYGETTSNDYSTYSSAFIINSSYTINLAQKNCGIKGIGIFRKGLTRPTTIAESDAGLALFSGIAVTVGDGVTSNAASDTYFGHCLVIGFAYAYRNILSERPTVEYIKGDCLNGIWLSQVFDMNHLNNCHFYPFWNAHASFGSSTPSGWQRSGVAYYLDRVDWGQVNECFSYGYQTGFQIQDSDHSTLLNCGADDNPTLFPRLCYGYLISGGATAVNLIGCKTAAKTVGLYINSTDNNGEVLVNGGAIWGVHSTAGGQAPTAIVINAGRLLINGMSINDVTNGITTVGTSQASIDGCFFGSISTVFNFADNKRVTLGKRNLFNGSTSNKQPTYTFDNQPSGEVVYSFSNIGGNHTGDYYGARGSLAAPTILVNNDKLGGHSYYGYDGSAYLFAAGWRVTAGNPAAGVMSGRIIFNTNNAGTIADRVVINPAGLLEPVTDNAYALGEAALRWSAVWAANGTIQTSDARTKKDIAHSALGLDFINALRPVSYKWIEGSKRVIRQEVNEDGSPGEIITESVPGTRTHWGLIAQEVKAACDAAGVDFGGHVLTDINDPDSQQALRYDQFVAPLIKAVQELTARVLALEAR